MSMEQLVRALEGLQNDAARRQEYNDWLQEFRRGMESWQVSYEVLESDAYPRSLKIFCAQTLRNKIIHDLHQVPRDARMHLKEQVLVLLEKNKSLLTVVGAQLCVALAAFAMQVAEWEHPVQELMARFETVEMVPLLFEFLKVIPEEFSSTRAGMVDISLRLKKSESLIRDTAPLVLNFMLSRADIMSQSGSMQCLFFETLKPWLNEVDLPDIIASPLVDWMLASVDNMDARSAAVDCLISVVKESNDVMEPVVQEAIKVLYPKLIQLAQMYQSQYEENPDLHRDLTRLFSAAAEAWHVLICKDPQNFLPLLGAVKECIATSGGDMEVVEYTFEVFDQIRTMLGERLPGSSTPLSAEIPREPFKPIFLELFQEFAKLLQFPESFYGNLEEEETFRDFRYDIGDMLKICSSILGHEEALRLCYTNLQQLQQVHCTNWQPVEALLFAIRAIARTVPSEENEWLPTIYDLFTQMPCGDNELVKHAALMLLGRYSMWSANHPQYLGFELEYILSSVWSEHMEVRRAAAHAFLYLCTDASREHVPFLPQILEMYNSLSGNTDLESICKYSDGIGAIVNHLSGTELSSAIQILYKPVTERSMELLKQRDNSASTNNDTQAFQQQLAYDIQGLGSVVAMIATPECDLNESLRHPLVVEVKGHHELFMNLMSAYGLTSDVLLEGIARYYCRVVFNLGFNFSQELPLLLKNSNDIISAEPMTSVLYELSSAIIQCFNAQIPLCTPEIQAQVWEFSVVMCRSLFSEKTNDLLKIQGGIVDHITLLSSVIHHGFHMLCDITISYPHQFFATLIVPSVLLSVQVFDLCWDTEALNAVSHFYDDVESFLPVIGGVNRGSDPAVIEKIGQTFELHGYALVHSLFYWFLLKPDVHFEAVVEHMVDLSFRMAPVASVSWLQQLMETLPVGTVSDEEKIVFSQHVFQLMSSGKYQGIGLEMNNFMKAYSARNFQPR